MLKKEATVLKIASEVQTAMILSLEFKLSKKQKVQNLSDLETKMKRKQEEAD